MIRRLGSLWFFGGQWSNERFMLAWHPQHSATWYWSLSWEKRREGDPRHLFKVSTQPPYGYPWMQRHDYLHLLWQRFRFSRQRYHKAKTGSYA